MPVSAESYRAHKALLMADVVESVRLIAASPTDVIDRWRAFVHEVRGELLPARGGRLVKSLGDGFLLDFDLVPSAAAAALELQRRIARHNAGRPPELAILLRVAVHFGEVVIDGIDVYGPPVNLVARLTALASPGECVVSAEVADLLVPGVDADVEDLGDCYLKHIDGPVRVFRLGPAPALSALVSVDERRRNDLRPGIAVLPFECSLGHDPGDMFGEALADELISLLARSRDLHVISSLSTRSLKGRRMDAAEVAARLGAPYVLSGRYRMLGGWAHLNVELADVRSGQLLWADGFDTSIAAAFDPQAPLADRIVAALGKVILAQELELALSLPMPALDSYTLLFGAISLMHRQTLREFQRAHDLLEHLAYRQGRRGAAHAWLAKWHVLRAVQGWSPDPQAESVQALDRVQRALDANPQDGLALAIGGLVHGYLRKDLGAAGRMYDDALAANPNEPLAWLFSATRHGYLGEGHDAESAGEMALSLSPLDPMRYFFDSLAATAMLANANWQRSMELAQRSVRANRTHASTWRTLAYALVMLERVDEAKQAVAELRAIEPGYTVGEFRRRFPGRDGPMAQPWASALGVAGLPE